MSGAGAGRKMSLLFICTGNCCRSQMAEAIARQVAGDRFEVFSCGSDPAGFVHPLSLGALETMGIDTSGLESKSWDVFLNRNIDIAITVCDSANQTCPVFPGGGFKAHWPLPDPSFMDGTYEEREEFALRIAERIKLKVQRLAALDFKGTKRKNLQHELDLLADL